jgi:hypothetical protein
MGDVDDAASLGDVDGCWATAAAVAAAIVAAARPLQTNLNMRCLSKRELDALEAVPRWLGPVSDGSSA